MMAGDIAKNLQKGLCSEARKSNDKENAVPVSKLRNRIPEELRNRNEQAKVSSYVGKALQKYSKRQYRSRRPYIAPMGSVDTRQHEA
jgi:hypothetical protein